MANWGPVRSIAVGGLVAVGFLDEERVFVGSHSGVAILHADSGRRIGRAVETDGSYGWFTESPPSGTWAEEDGAHTVPVAGLWGGRLSEVTPDGWRVERVDGGARVTGPDGTALAISDDEDVRALGFSPAGRVVVYATSSTLHIAAR